MNRHEIIGNIGKDPETKHFEGGNQVTKFSVATSNGYYDKDKAEWINQDPTWHSVVCWGKLSEYASEHLKKGSQVYVEGPVKNRTVDMDDGSKRFYSETVAKTLKQFVVRAKSGYFPEGQAVIDIPAQEVKSDNWMEKSTIV